MEENKNVKNVDAEIEDEEVETAAEQPKPKKKKKPEDPVMMEVHPVVAKVVKGARKVLKYAVPAVITVGSIVLGFKLGSGNEKKKSSAAAADYQSQISDLQFKLEQKPDIPVSAPAVDLDTVFEAVKDTAEEVVEF